MIVGARFGLERLRTEQEIHPAIRSVCLLFNVADLQFYLEWIIELGTSWDSDTAEIEQIWHVNPPKCPPTVSVGLMNSAADRLRLRWLSQW